ncbi:MAG: hypothetical protein AAGH15_25605 [Myxococcota bacterium]
MDPRRGLALAFSLACWACGDDAAAPLPSMDAGFAATLPAFDPLGDGGTPPISADPEREAQCGYAPLAPPEPDAAPYCTPATRACVDACGPLTPTNVECVFGCLGRDMSPPTLYFGDCVSCAFRLLVGCAQARGCEDAYVAQRCCQVACAEDECADPSCTAEEDAVNFCIFTEAASCLDLTSETYALCFGPAPTEGDGP